MFCASEVCVCVCLMSVVFIIHALRSHWLWLLTLVIFLNRRHCVRICSFSKVNFNLLMTLRRQQQSTCSPFVYKNQKKTYRHQHIGTHTHTLTIGFHLHGIELTSVGMNGYRLSTSNRFHHLKCVRNICTYLYTNRITSKHLAWRISCWSFYYFCRWMFGQDQINDFLCYAFHTKTVFKRHRTAVQR